MQANALRPPRTRRVRRRPLPKEIKDASPPETSSSSSSTSALLWTISLIGLAFCLADVAYILHYVDSQQSVGVHRMSNQLAGWPSFSKNNINNNNNAYDRLGIDAGIPLEEFKVLDRMRQIHAEQIYQEQQDQLKQQLQPVDKVNATLDNIIPSTPLTDEEWAAIRSEKKPILDMLAEAHIPILELDSKTLRDLPTWKEVTDLYGHEPRIYGLEQCEAFQTQSDPAEHFVSTAGTFNSGTNLMAELLIHNCHIQPRMEKYGWKNQGVRWQVPWGKHTPPGDEEFRLKHKTLKSEGVDATNILPAVTIRDPYVWMNRYVRSLFHVTGCDCDWDERDLGCTRIIHLNALSCFLSMCRIEYSAHWHHDPNRHCPNLIPDSTDLTQFGRFLKEGQPVKVHVKYSGFWKHHDSLVGMWNDWYREYYDAVDFNRLIVRYEDLLFFPRQVTEAVCKCAGGSLRRDGHFLYVVDSAKKGATAHGPMELRTGFLKAIIKYGKATNRASRYSKDDLDYAEAHLDKELMDFFRYKHPHELRNSS
jgi:hypothetical protein